MAIVDPKYKENVQKMVLFSQKGDVKGLAELLSSGEPETRGAAFTRTIYEGQTPLHFSCLGTAELLLMHGADIDAQDKRGMSIAHIAAMESESEGESDSTKFMELLIRHKANLQLQTEDHNTPLHLAIGSGTAIDNSEMVEFLIQNKSNVNARGYNKYTPLLLAINYYRTNLIELLI